MASPTNSGTRDIPLKFSKGLYIELNNNDSLEKITIVI